ncbi:MAG: M23 family metallopeptidase, partial [Bdellovibrionota bacterium]
LPLKVVDGNYPSETLHVAGKHVNPSPRMMPRIQREQHEAAAIYDRLTKVKYWNGPFQMPVKSAITSAFGSKRIYNGELKNFHPGVDLKAPMRTRIRAAAPGVIVMAKNLYYTGNTVMIDHGYGVITLYAHMSKLKVKKGQLVRSGQLLGLSGMTGRVTGPHLHWQAVIHHVKINPLDLTKVMR